MTTEQSPSLAERVEKAEVGSRELDWELHTLLVAPWWVGARWTGLGYVISITKDGRTAQDHMPLYTTSVDAALALVERQGLDAWPLLYAAMMSWKAHDPRGPLSRELPLAICAALLKSQEPEQEPPR